MQHCLMLRVPLAFKVAIVFEVYLQSTRWHDGEIVGFHGFSDIYG